MPLIVSFCIDFLSIMLLLIIVSYSRTIPPYNGHVTHFLILDYVTFGNLISIHEAYHFRRIEDEGFSPHVLLVFLDVEH